MTRGWFQVVGVAAVVVGSVAVPRGTHEQVAHAADSVIEVDATCSLVTAINDANDGTVSPSCNNHDAGSRTIQITSAAGATVIPSSGDPATGVQVDISAVPGALTGGALTALPDIRVPMTIEGDGSPRVGIYASGQAAQICNVAMVNGVLTLVCNSDASQPRGARLFHVAANGNVKAHTEGSR